MRSSSAVSYRTCRAIVRAQSGTKRRWTSGAQRYSSGRRSKAGASGSPERSWEIARAGPISFWAIEEKAASSSSTGAIPVHSELRQPRTSSSSAISSSACSFPRFSQLRLQRVAVHPVVVLAQLVDEVLEDADRLARHGPEGDGLAAAPELLVRVRVGEGLVRRVDRAGVLKRIALALLPEDLVDHAASARIAVRTQAVSSRVARRSSSRSAVFGPWPVTTERSSSQSGSVYSQTPSSRFRSFGSGSVSPSSQICGT